MDRQVFCLLHTRCIAELEGLLQYHAIVERRHNIVDIAVGAHLCSQETDPVCKASCCGCLSALGISAFTRFAAVTCRCHIDRSDLHTHSLGFEHLPAEYACCITIIFKVILSAQCSRCQTFHFYGFHLIIRSIFSIAASQYQGKFHIIGIIVQW